MISDPNRKLWYGSAISGRTRCVKAQLFPCNSSPRDGFSDQSLSPQERGSPRGDFDKRDFFHSSGVQPVEDDEVHGRSQKADIFEVVLKIEQERRDMFRDFSHRHGATSLNGILADRSFVLLFPLAQLQRGILLGKGCALPP